MPQPGQAVEKTTARADLRPAVLAVQIVQVRSSVASRPCSRRFSTACLKPVQLVEYARQIARLHVTDHRWYTMLELLEVVADRIDRQSQPGRNLLVGRALQPRPQHVGLPR